MKVAFSSDIHLDINHLDVNQVVSLQANYLKRQAVDYYFIIGDSFNDFQKTLNYVHSLQQALPKVIIKFLAGNHDMFNGINYEDLETEVDANYFHNQFVDLPKTNWRIIGNNGWYDYSYAAHLKRSADRFYHWKQAYWADRIIEQPESDISRFQRALTQVNTNLLQAKQHGRKTVLLTHFVPNQHFIHYTADDRFFNMANGMLGGIGLERLINQYHVPLVVFGHLHRRFTPITIKDTRYYNVAVGYHNRRHNEWQNPDFIREWQQQTKIINFF